MAVGALVLAAGLVGTLAGVSVKGDEQGQAAVTAPLPPAKPHVQTAAPVTAEPATAAEPTVRTRRIEPRPQRSAAEAAATPEAVETAADSATQAPVSDAAADP